MEVITAVIGIIVAAVAGFYIGRSNSVTAQENVRLESELKQKEQELESFRGKVNNHFEKTASLFNQVSDSYQTLYEHMATSSNQLCATQTFQSLPKSRNTDNLEMDGMNSHKAETSKQADSEDMFDANNLYNAHGYRNEDEQESDAIAPDESAIGYPPINDNKVVDIESAKEDSSEPALDYAVKEKGVINHNSLNIEGVKSS